MKLFKRKPTETKSILTKSKLKIVGLRYFDTTYGFFKVLKSWRVDEFHKNSEPHFSSYYKILIKTDNGTKFIIPSYQLNELVWNRSYDK